MTTSTEWTAADQADYERMRATIATNAEHNRAKMDEAGIPQQARRGFTIATCHHHERIQSIERRERATSKPRAHEREYFIVITALTRPAPQPSNLPHHRPTRPRHQGLLTMIGQPYQPLAADQRALTSEQAQAQARAQHGDRWTESDLLADGRLRIAILSPVGGTIEEIHYVAPDGDLTIEDTTMTTTEIETETETDTPTIPTTITETWTYAGRRTGTSNPLLHVYLDDDGQNHVFKKPLGTVIGGRYEMTLTPDRDTVIGQPDYIDDDHHPEEQVLEWTALDRAAANRAAVRRQERRAKDTDPLREALLPLRRIMHGRLSHNDKYALVAAITAEMWRPLTRDEQEQR